MKRPASGEKNLDRVLGWRAAVPQLTVRSTFIAGFPGETDSEFEHLLDFLREAQLDRVGCFAYSPVEGAAANQLPGAVPDALREERRGRFMAVQQEISRARLARKVGSTQRVIIDSVGPKGAVGRSSADAPQIDGVVQISSHASLRVGQFATVLISGCDDHDLQASVLTPAD
jgi:ribosomal protein S12 methylthiotransferase